MASIRKRGDYQWEVRVRRQGHPVQCKTLNTKIEAEAWARQIEGEMDRGVFVSRVEAERTTLADALDRYIREIIPLKKQSVRETNRARMLQRTPLSKRFLASIHGKDIADFRDARAQSGAGANTIRLDLALISHLYAVAVKEWGMAGLVNPVSQIRKPKLPQGRDRRLLPGELDRICSASDSPALADLVRFALETAMRRSEIAGMTWDRVDLKKRTVVIPETKNGERRIVPLSTEAVRILSSLPRKIDGEVWGMEPDSITQAFLRALARARRLYEKECEERKEKPDLAFLVDLTFHDLRHEATSRFFEKGLNPMQVAAITGHKTLQMLKRYTHLKAEDLAEMLK